VASKAIHHLRKDSTIGTISMKKLLEDEHKCEIHYDTVVQLEGRGTAAITWKYH
jgi:hypothetical protein